MEFRGGSSKDKAKPAPAVPSISLDEPSELSDVEDFSPTSDDPSESSSQSFTEDDACGPLPQNDTGSPGLAVHDPRAQNNLALGSTSSGQEEPFSVILPGRFGYTDSALSARFSSQGMKKPRLTNPRKAVKAAAHKPTTFDGTPGFGNYPSKLAKSSRIQDLLEDFGLFDNGE